MSDPILIRPYEERDFDRLEKIHDPARKNELLLAGLSDAFIPLAIAADREGLFGYQVYVAEYKGQVSGFIAFEEDEIAWLYVDINCARRGIGSALMEFAMQRVNDNVSIEVLSGNTPAIALYSSFGFEIKETLSGHMPGNEEFEVCVHVMGK